VTQQSPKIEDLAPDQCLTDTEALFWYAIYVEDGDYTKSDLHQRFADAIGKSRQEAKKRAYMILFQGPFMLKLAKQGELEGGRG
jgi:hypothetical protein